MIGAPAVLAPLFVQVALTFALLLWLGRLRVRAVRSGAVRPGDIDLGQPGWPPRIAQVSNAFHNQLELPMLFYLATVLALLTATASATFVTLAWLFVVTRLAHALVHVTTNDLTRRFVTFTAGLALLAAMWLWLVAAILL